jgi:predicted dehydrogenase
MAARLDASAALAAGCFSRDAGTNAAAGADLGIDPARVYPSWRELVEGEKGKSRFIAICTPNSSHFEIAKAALESGFDVLCEKPVATTAAEAETLLALVRKTGRAFAVPFTYTGFPMVKLARELVAKGELGKVCKVVVEYQQGSFRKLASDTARRVAWKMDPALSGPSCVVADIGVHAFEIVEYVTGLETRSVLADLSSFVHSAGLDDDASVLMRLGDGAKASMTVSKIATGEENGLRLRVYGEKASLHWNQEEPNSLVVRFPFGPDKTYRRRAPYMAAVSPLADAASRIPAGHGEGFIEAFANIYRNFCGSVRTGEPGDFPGIAEAARAMLFVEAVLSSDARGGAWTEIKHV